VTRMIELACSDATALPISSVRSLSVHEREIERLEEVRPAVELR
jgi:hypothetical protein